MALEYGLEVDLSAYDASNFFRSLRIQASQGGAQRSYDEMGTGQEQLLAIAFGYAYAKAFSETSDQLLLAIEEPEAHLHPVAQEWLASQVLRFAEEGIQVLLTTHSPYFVSLERLSGAVRISREDGTGSTIATQLTPPRFAQHCHSLGVPASVTVASLPKFYEANATTEIRSGLLSACVVLVEGDTEELAIPGLLRRADEATYRRGWKVVPCGGKAAIPKWIRLCKAYEIPFHVVIDSDDEPADTAPHVDLLAAMDVDVSVLADLPGKPGVHCGAQLTVMGKNFETAMRKEYPDYAGFEAEARDTVGLRSKPEIARYVTERIDLDTSTAAHRITSALARYHIKGPAAPSTDVEPPPF